MNRLAALLAFSALGSGCIITHEDRPGDVTFYWQFARHAPAVSGGFVYYDVNDPPVAVPANRSCAESAVDTVTIVDPAGVAQEVACVYENTHGIQFLGVPGGTFTSRIRGYRGTSLVYDTGYLDLTVDGDSAWTVSVPGVSAGLDLFGDLATGTPSSPTLLASCAAAGAPDVGYEIADVFGTVVDDGQAPCDDPLPSPVFADVLDLDDFYVRLQAPATGPVAFDSCWQPLTHFADQTGADGLSYVMVDDPGTCPSPFSM